MSTFANGQAAFLRNWDYGYSYANTAASPSKIVGKVGVAPLPTFAGQHLPGHVEHRRLEPVHQPAQQEHRG